jgi:hypothetical protein
MKTKIIRQNRLISILIVIIIALTIVIVNLISRNVKLKKNSNKQESLLQELKKPIKINPSISQYSKKESNPSTFIQAPIDNQVNNVIPTEKECVFNRVAAKTAGYTDEEINTYLNSLPPGYCPTHSNRNNSISQEVENIEDCSIEMKRYSDCLDQENRSLEEYRDCINSLITDRYCPKPMTGFCNKPSCSY